MIRFDGVYDEYSKLTKEFFYGKEIEDVKKKSQYFTPIIEAEKLVDDLEIGHNKVIRILDPSCGNGILIFKFIEKILKEYSPTKIIIDIYDIDEKLLDNVKSIVDTIRLSYTKLVVRYFNMDFLKSNHNKKYDYIIMNPPYKKINIREVPKALEKLVYGQPNLYHLFITKSLSLLKREGTLCIISPKNYLSGKYTEKLRRYIFNKFSITKIHIFNDRRKIFGNNITQEICIVHIKKSNVENIIMSYNSGLKFMVKIDKIMIKNESKIIFTPRHIDDYELIQRFEKFPIGTIGRDILMKVGKVVQFRIKGKDYNIKNEEFMNFENGLPLIVYRHINEERLKYKPLINKSKNNGITLLDDKTNESILIKNGKYVLIRKNVDKKYEKLIHSIGYFNELKAEKIAIDNGIIYFTNIDDSLTSEEVLGLQCILMSKQFDDYYRMINSSHTINVYELENMNFPDIKTIREIGANINNYLTVEKATEIFEKYI